MYIKVQTSSSDEFYLERDELDGVDLHLRIGAIELFSLVSTYPWNFLRPLLLIAAERIKSQGRVLEISSIIIEQNFDKCRQQVQGWEEGFLSCSREIQNSYVFDGCKLFGQDLQIQSNSQE